MEYQIMVMNFELYSGDYYNDAVIITHGAGLLFGNQWITNSFVYDLNIGVIVYEGSI